MNKHVDRDTMSRVSCGKAASEGYRRERRDTEQRSFSELAEQE